MALGACDDGAWCTFGRRRTIDVVSHAVRCACGGRLSPEVGAVVQRALEAAVDRLRQEPATAGDRCQVVLHVEGDSLRATGETGQAVLEETGAYVSAETSRRLACDASLVVMRHDVAGAVLDVGRKMRTIPPAIRRALAVLTFRRPDGVTIPMAAPLPVWQRGRSLFLSDVRCLDRPAVSVRSRVQRHSRDTSRPGAHQCP
jgi:hypothetical protein